MQWGMHRVTIDVCFAFELAIADFRSCEWHQPRFHSIFTGKLNCLLACWSSPWLLCIRSCTAALFSCNMHMLLLCQCLQLKNFLAMACIRLPDSSLRKVFPGLFVTACLSWRLVTLLLMICRDTQRYTMPHTEAQMAQLAQYCQQVLILTLQASPYVAQLEHTRCPKSNCFSH